MGDILCQIQAQVTGPEMRSKKLGKAEIPSLDLETKLSALVWSRNRKSRKLNKPSAKMLTMKSRRPRRMEKLFYDMYHTNLQGSIRGISPWDLHDHKNTQV